VYTRSTPLFGFVLFPGLVRNLVSPFLCSLRQHYEFPSILYYFPLRQVPLPSSFPLPISIPYPSPFQPQPTYLHNLNFLPFPTQNLSPPHPPTAHTIRQQLKKINSVHATTDRIYTQQKAIQHIYPHKNFPILKHMKMRCLPIYPIATPLIDIP
jgi:hypothetical protein